MLPRRSVPHHAHPANRYASGPLDRADEMRRDGAALGDFAMAGNARYVPVWQQATLVDYTDGDVTARFLSVEEMAVAVEATGGGGVGIFLGLDDLRRPYFALDLGTGEAAPESLGGAFEDLRKTGPALNHEAGAILAYARGMVHWDRRHRFCGACGHPAEAAKGGHERRCTNAACGAVHFPRTDPAVIMLIHDGGDRAVLGRQPVWPPGMHSVLAGFVEPGESLEDAVAREVMEEVGLPVADVTYKSSQPWPFPSSIMLGFTARATGFDLRVAEDEIESARWMSRAELLASPEDESFKLPRPDSIARRLIEDWLADGAK
ncbi:NAD(+) diphosphatase [Marivibrio halodurans]|uniref:NAD(+) diphosphatase n=2 Tax=Marivibrio halodurans TaxID=2039722 RepID=A0A8J7RXF8_9PROT|nr:NAD(+) diphosphatase [Marivibrio halodurans]